MVIPECDRINSYEMSNTSHRQMKYIIRARNEEPNFEKCVPGIKGLDYHQDRYEIIVADGHSEDRPAEIARSLGASRAASPRVARKAAAKRVQGKGNIQKFYFRTGCIKGKLILPVN